MAEVFIDANMFLRFYSSERIGKLIELLDEVQDHILLPSQIYDEIERNKVRVAKVHIKTTFPDSHPKLTLLSHLLSVKVADRKALETRNIQLNADVKKLFDDIKEKYNDALRQISLSEDHISISLGRLFSHRKYPSDKEIAKARLRKEIGNPPGKRNDPLGDQISWEQFLSSVGRPAVVWIITADSDYCQTLFSKELVLNPILMGDLRSINSVIEARCFSSISEGIDDFRKSLDTQLNNAPDDSDFEEMKKAEAQIPVISSYEEDLGRLPLIYCPNCNAENTINDIGWRMSQNGDGLSWHKQCTKCGLLIDTGENSD